MALHEQEAIKVNLVLVGIRLLTESRQLESFSELVGGDAVTRTLGLEFTSAQKPPEPTTLLEFPKDRITLQLGAGRSVIERAYPDTSDLHDLSRIAEVTTLAVDKSELDGALPTGHDYNVEMVYEQDSGETADKYLSQRLFRANDLAAQGWDAVGGGGRLTYEASDERWEFVAEPRYRSRDTHKVFLALNLHKEQPVIPEQSDIATTLERVWNEACALSDRIDRGTPA